MKITRIETHVCHARMRNWVFVKVCTDQDGLFGWGEATLEWHTRAIVGAIEDVAELLIGEDPTRIEYLWQMMYRQHFWHAHGIVRATAHGRDRPRAVGHPGQGRRPALRATLGRSGARSRADLLPPGRRQAGGFLRNGCRRRAAFCGPRPPGRRRGLYRLQVDGGAAHHAAGRAEADSHRRNSAWRRCARPWARRSTSWSTAMPGLRRRWACSSPKPWNPTGCTSLRNRAGPRASMAWHASMPPCRRRSPRASASRNWRPSANCSRLGLATCANWTSRTAAGFSEARRIAALAEAYRIALAPHNPQGPVSTAGLAGVRLLAAQLHHLRKPSTATCPGARTWWWKVSPSNAKAGSSGRIRNPGWASRSTRPKSNAIRSSRRCRSASSTRMAVSGTGRQKE